MKTRALLLFLSSSLVVSASQAKDYPQAEISNGLLKAHLYLPDSEDGYYTETRFDWSGLISSLEYKGHTFFGPWHEEESPIWDEIAMGPVEAYYPLNYGEAEPGETFVQIGVGAMTKPSDEKYVGFNPYPIVDSGLWTIETASDQVQFVQVLNSERFSYEYTKTVQLVADRPEMVISHVLENTGEELMETFMFNHNFLVIDNQPIDKGFVLTFPVEMSGNGRGSGDIYEINGKEIVFLRGMDAEESFACKYLEGLTGVEGYEVRVDSLNTGAGVRITGDQPLSRLRLWGNSKTVCPETYLDIKVAPGETFRWSYGYTFYATDASKSETARQEDTPDLFE